MAEKHMKTFGNSEIFRAKQTDIKIVFDLSLCTFQRLQVAQRSQNIQN